ncbi:hypothetical protein DACRYDRAFT_105815 [Dacryopinax primogenitus]|uniref:Zn(2)-C6 fungal-type domain-containing protein n=1 Tax=Dacryopinax primogenitus (strain DJM 731) TaxID=1858805 RepID=M5GC37_DACPD|nr:uncharacterized protein DACRYDRAFT_105815 [Dacryopinax primogenitus]EJU03652.1 hypothetical protein DACRYDRAFT_105815 [Dacryopinax primogenitus]
MLTHSTPSSTLPPLLGNRTRPDPMPIAFDKRSSEEEDAAERRGVRKRKRLSKACDACHKSKRRCDGRSPCANCEFATKTCVYTDSLGRAVAAPHARSEDLVSLLFPRPALASQLTSPLRSAPYPPQGVMGPRPIASGPLTRPSGGLPVNIMVDTPQMLKEEYPWAKTEELRKALTDVMPNTRITVDPTIKLELTNIFFNKCTPYNLMIHKPTFLSMLTNGSLPNYILLSIMALAAPYSSHPALRILSPNGRPWQQGEIFAEPARRVLLDRTGNVQLDYTLEVAQALIMLHVHEVSMRRSSGANGRYMTMALDILLRFETHRLDASGAMGETTEPTKALLAESYRRTFWLIYFIESLCSTFTERPLSFKESEFAVRLPMKDSRFEIFADAEPPTEFLRPGGQDVTEPGAFGYLVRITSIYVRIAALIIESQNIGMLRNTETHRRLTTQLQECERSLTDWQLSLPLRLRFNEANLRMHIHMYHIAGGFGWAFAYMHALSECCMLAIYEVFDEPPMTRSKQAIANLMIILDWLEPKGRSNIATAWILLALLQHYDRARVEPDARVQEWCHEYEAQYGIKLDDIRSPSFRQNWMGPRVHAPRLINGQGTPTWQAVGQPLSTSAAPRPSLHIGTTNHYDYPMGGGPAHTYGPTFPPPRTTHTPYNGITMDPLPTPATSHWPGDQTLGPLPSLPRIFDRQEVSAMHLSPVNQVSPYTMPYTDGYLSGPNALPHHHQYPSNHSFRIRTNGLPASSLDSLSGSTTDRFTSVSPADEHAQPAKRAPVGLGWLADEPRAERKVGLLD